MVVFCILTLVFDFLDCEATLDELQSEQAREQESYKEQIEEVKERCFEKQNKVKEAR